MARHPCQQNPVSRDVVPHQVSVRVRSALEAAVTTLHWHGVEQRGSPWMDGAAGVSQCPIQPGQTYHYRSVPHPAGPDLPLQVSAPSSWARPTTTGQSSGPHPASRPDLPLQVSVPSSQARPTTTGQCPIQPGQTYHYRSVPQPAGPDLPLQVSSVDPTQPGQTYHYRSVPQPAGPDLPLQVSAPTSRARPTTTGQCSIQPGQTYHYRSVPYPAGPDQPLQVSVPSSQAKPTTTGQCSIQPGQTYHYRSVPYPAGPDLPLQVSAPSSWARPTTTGQCPIQLGQTYHYRSVPQPAGPNLPPQVSSVCPIQPGQTCHYRSSHPTPTNCCRSVQCVPSDQPKPTATGQFQSVHLIAICMKCQR